MENEQQQKLSAYDRLVYKNLMQKEASLSKEAVNWSRIGARLGDVVSDAKRGVSRIGDGAKRVGKSVVEGTKRTKAGLGEAKRVGKSILDSAREGFGSHAGIDASRVRGGKAGVMWHRLKDAGRGIAGNEYVRKGRMAVDDYVNKHPKAVYAGIAGLSAAGGLALANSRQKKRASYRVLEKLSSGDGMFLMKMAACCAKKGKCKRTAKRKLGC